MTNAKPSEQEIEAGIMRGLVAIDDLMLKAGASGPPGAGLYALLEQVAQQFFGSERKGFPATEAEPEAEGEATPQVEPGSLSEQAIEAGSQGAHHGAKGKK